MKREIELDDFIDALVRAREYVRLAQQWDAKIAAYTTQQTTLTNQIAILTKEANGLAASLAERKQAGEKELENRRAAAESAFAAYKVNQESLRQQEERAVLDAKRATASAIATFQAQESDAKQAASTAQAELKVIIEALDRARHDASKLAQLANVGRA
jgi:hypothetical protein